MIPSVERAEFGLAVSSDGESILFSQFDFLNDDIMLVENFR